MVRVAEINRGGQCGHCAALAPMEYSNAVLIFTLALILGLAALIWSADRFIAGASGIARYLGMSPLLIGMLIVGFGTSAPEMLVSAI